MAETTGYHLTEAYYLSKLELSIHAFYTKTPADFHWLFFGWSIHFNKLNRYGFW